MWVRCPDGLIWLHFVVDVGSVRIRCRSTACHWVVIKSRRILPKLFTLYCPSLATDREKKGKSGVTHYSAQYRHLQTSEVLFSLCLFCAFFTWNFPYITLYIIYMGVCQYYDHPTHSRIPKNVGYTIVQQSCDPQTKSCNKKSINKSLMFRVHLFSFIMYHRTLKYVSCAVTKTMQE